jgi:hypothetical protein
VCRLGAATTPPSSHYFLPNTHTEILRIQRRFGRDLHFMFIGVAEAHATDEGVAREDVVDFAQVQLRPRVVSFFVSPFSHVYACMHVVCMCACVFCVLYAFWVSVLLF